MKLKTFLQQITGRTKAFYTRDALAGKGYDIGEHTYGRPRVHAWGEEKATLKIGRFCSIARHVSILLGGNHHAGRISTYPFGKFPDRWPGAAASGDISYSKGDVIIGNDVWIGEGAVILSGVTVADGAVIGAHAVVTKDVEPYAIVAGNPARVIRKRFDDNTIARLLEVKWWDWPEEKITRYADLLSSERLDEFFTRIEAEQV
ncbi:MAG: CatB-related O-acetyltransferase [Sedimentisphaerales bacterium]|nr:CatB-related O-acetyltransferase [Sedimentisphaerales bacterium]